MIRRASRSLKFPLPGVRGKYGRLSTLEIMSLLCAVEPAYYCDANTKINAYAMRKR